MSKYCITIIFKQLLYTFRVFESKKTFSILAQKKFVLLTIINQYNFQFHVNLYATKYGKKIKA